MPLSDLRPAWWAATLLAGALGCAAASDPLFGARPTPPVSPRTWVQPPYPQALVVTESLPQETRPAPAPAPAPDTPAPQPGEAPPSDPPTADDVPVTAPAVEAPAADPDPVDLERGRNEATFEDSYLRQKERLFAANAGRWIAIVDGRLLPVDARGRVAPAAEFGECLAAADSVNPNALHRFVFRVGEEGDVVYPDPLASARAMVGMGLKLQLGIATTFDPAASAVMWTRAGKSRRFAVERDQIELRLADPAGRQFAAIHLADSSSFSGFLLLEPTLADLLDAERFEIPGRVVLKHGEQLRELRRSRLRVQVAELELDEPVPAAIWID
ncbi:MAG: hypothetical protein EXS13_14735 [Planctomycetes bacterium]|nr:hypothetical protein [Planctomycetota bacterium]